RLRRHARLQGADRAARSMGDCRLRPRAAAQPARDDGRHSRRRSDEAAAGRTGRTPVGRAQVMETPRVTTNVQATTVPDIDRLGQRGLILGIVGLAAGGAGYFMNPDQFFRSWLIGFMLVLGLAMGSLALLMLQHMSGGQWGMVGRRVFEAASRTLWF